MDPTREYYIRKLQKLKDDQFLELRDVPCIGIVMDIFDLMFEDKFKEMKGGEKK